MRDKPTDPMEDGRTNRYVRQRPSTARYGLQSYGPAPVSLLRRWLYITGIGVGLVAVGLVVWWMLRNHSAAQGADGEAQPASQSARP